MNTPWLVDAKRLAIGQHKRFRCCGRTPAAIIWNNQDSWSMYCHRCKQNYFVKKQYVQLNGRIQVERSSMFSVPADIKDISQLSTTAKVQIYTFLIKKGIHPYMLDNQKIAYSTSTRRIMFYLPDGSIIGRYYPRNEFDTPINKWCVYLSNSNFCIVKNYTPTSSNRLIILTEDYLSALKVAYCIKEYPQYEVIACLGTGISKALRAYIATNSVNETICMFDGDKAGRHGAELAHKVLRTFTKVRTEIFDGVDPKDLNIKIIKDLIFK